MFDRFTDHARKAMGYARQESQRLCHDYIGTAHLLLGLIGEDGVAARVLDELGVNRDRVSEGLGADAWQSPVRLRCDEVARLKAEVEDLRRRNDALQERIDRLESEG